MAVAGASQYLNQATLANKQGFSTETANLLGASGATAVSLLDIGRSLTSIEGIGLSTNARILNSQLIEQNSGTYNALFSAGAEGGGGTIESAMTLINALRSTAPQSQVDDSVRGKNIDEQV